jgi:hypothetical protein
VFKVRVTTPLSLPRVKSSGEAAREDAVMSCSRLGGRAGAMLANAHFARRKQ